VVVDLGVGSMTIPRDRIATITRSGPKEQEAIRKEWERRNFLHRKYVPKGWEDIAQTLRDILDQRDRAVSALRVLGDSDKSEAQAREKIFLLQAAMLETSRKLLVISPQQNVTDYNQLVAESNAIQAKTALLYQEVEKLIQARKTAKQTVSEYVSSVATLKDSFQKRLATVRQPGEDSTTHFLGKVSGRLTELDRECAVVSVPTATEGGGTIVSALINNRLTGRFLVDTGASVMTLSEEFAKRLGIDLGSLPSGTAVVADGKKVAARQLVLDSVQVGDAKVGPVQAAVLPGAMGPSVDGLLGMSYLKNFDVRLSAANGQLVLTRFTP
jgi:clan AA aspartic protease (TIGR02281 family)